MPGTSYKKTARKQARKAIKAAGQKDKAIKKAVRQEGRRRRGREMDRDSRQILLDNEYNKGKKLYGSGANQILKQLGKKKK